MPACWTNEFRIPCIEVSWRLEASEILLSPQNYTEERPRQSSLQLRSVDSVTLHHRFSIYFLIRGSPLAFSALVAFSLDLWLSCRPPRHLRRELHSDHQDMPT